MAIYYLDKLNTGTNPVVADWFLVNQTSPIYIGLILVIYYISAFVVLPWAARKKFRPNLNVWMSIHNVLLVTFNLILATLLLWNMVKAKYSITCQPVPVNSMLKLNQNRITSMWNYIIWGTTTTKNRIKSVPDADANAGEAIAKYEKNLSSLLWWYFLTKIVELHDIVFSVLRMSENAKVRSYQVNPQVYHHSTMFLISWAAVKYLPGGSSALLSCINCSSHVIMYLYFCLSGINFSRSANSGNNADDGGNGNGLCNFMSIPSAKSFITSCTIFQFVLVVLHCITGIFSNCGYPPTVFAGLILMVGSYLMAFSFASYLSNCTIGLKLEDHENDVSSNANTHERNCLTSNKSPIQNSSPNLLHDDQSSSSINSNKDELIASSISVVARENRSCSKKIN